ncbi:hypothetical protein [Quisquiliibacterium transsilvanicum]|uniref:Uncharacterized protein n=1 Tax=Quisquiliibacterium transsilvanicum TaxID=1549638 RepID=A0A7W8HIZ4_9BURK|nr:hypothetical protein [Quisquiliibacterium transsilvanicum]MBB5272271.1 hypothetical protein [Quisquiliibacterium transsilvanicum]
MGNTSRMSPPRAQLELQAQATVLLFDEGRTVALPVGAQGLAETVLRHDPPTSLELERAIDDIEDALSAARVARVDGGELVTADPLLLSLPGLDRPGAGLARDDVEALFGRLASRAHGMPVVGTDLPHGRDVAAALLILRECMHHLGFERVAPAPS